VNDAVVHRGCLLRRPYGPRALAKLEDYERHRHQLRTCRICGVPISDPDDYLSLGPLSDFPDEPLARFDWFQAHLHCLNDWEQTPDLVAVLEDVSRSAGWEGDVLERLLDRIRSAWSPVA
jgi:hypothetical protein